MTPDLPTQAVARKLKIILVCMQYDYGVKARGYSYEYVNFYQVLVSMGHEVILFDFMEHLEQVGRSAMNQQLLHMVRAEMPDMAFFSLFRDEIEPATVLALRSITKTLCFFHDDTWRVTFSRFWATQFEYFTTPDVYGVYKYQQLGLTGAIHFPFGCNQQLFQNMYLEKQFDISFVGAWHPYRAWLLDGLKKQGYRLAIAGSGWPQGTISYQDMVKLFNQSKININLSNSISYDARYLLSSPRALLNTWRSPKNIEQLKARHYEISACGAFQLSYYVEGLERQYVIGEEIAIYLNRCELIEKVAFYLQNENLREEIAQRAYQKSMESHLFETRFTHTFAKMGLLDVNE